MPTVMSMKGCELVSKARSQAKGSSVQSQAAERRVIDPHVADIPSRNDSACNRPMDVSISLQLEHLRKNDRCIRIVVSCMAYIRRFRNRDSTRASQMTSVASLCTKTLVGLNPSRNSDSFQLDDISF